MLAKKIGLTSINAWISIVLVTNAFVWYFFVLEILENISNTLEINGFASILVWIAHFASLAFSAVFGASLSRRFTDRMSFLLLWMILGTATSIVSVLIDLTYVPNVLLLSSIWGISLGLGMPCCMGYFTENTEIEKRGRLGGIILLISGVSMTVLGMMAGDNIAVRT